MYKYAVFFISQNAETLAKDMIVKEYQGFYDECITKVSAPEGYSLENFKNGKMQI